ncbi:hypothetical protein D1Z90_11350 [Motilimonas pumila]|uniref:Uncharacterized protein n=1 Tax=Motilimonas pumila TaxID=2303987 RepID=A0A418YEC2_9GAMM|nr:hypothetical protein D1Z90_11350 [Motilimonas pumila]
MVAIAGEAEIESTRISVTAAISMIDTQLRAIALSPDGRLPQKLQYIRADLKPFILPKKESTGDFHVRCFMFSADIRSDSSVSA